MYIYQLPDWPQFRWDCNVLLTPLAAVRYKQGHLAGRMEGMAASLRSEALVQILASDVIKSAEIEGIILDKVQVYHSIAKRLDLDIDNIGFSNRTIDSITAMLLDATYYYDKPLTQDRLFGWHAALFPTGYSGRVKIRVADWRDDTYGPMQVISGPIEHEQIHFEAPTADRIENEMTIFSSWLNLEANMDTIIKAFIAQIWFLTIHPFENGNGRVARAISDMLLCRTEQSQNRFYSMSAQIALERDGYYNMLEITQKGSLDITESLMWFINCLDHALDNSENLLFNVLRKNRLQKTYSNLSINDRQRLVLNKLIESTDIKLTSTKWAQMTECSQDTASRDINALIKRGILTKSSAGGRSTSYVLLERADHKDG